MLEERAVVSEMCHILFGVRVKWTFETLSYQVHHYFSSPVMKLFQCKSIVIVSEACDS